MFQIETALLDFNEQSMAGSQSDKTSVIKRFVPRMSFVKIFFDSIVQAVLWKEAAEAYTSYGS